MTLLFILLIALSQLQQAKFIFSHITVAILHLFGITLLVLVLAANVSNAKFSETKLMPKILKFTIFSCITEGWETVKFMSCCICKTAFQIKLPGTWLLGGFWLLIEAWKKSPDFLHIFWAACDRDQGCREPQHKKHHCQVQPRFEK